MSDILKRYPVSQENIQNHEGNSLVCMSTITGNHEMLTLLLTKGFEVNTQNYDGNTPLHYAVDAQTKKCIDILINFGADESIENDQGMIPWELLK
jgi:ankyrin repeat protein